MLVSVLATNIMVFQHGDLVLPLASGLVMILVLFTLNMTYGFFVEARGMRQITGLFGQYVPPELVDEMARNPEQVQHGAARAGAVGAVFRRARLHDHFRSAVAGGSFPLHQRVPHHA